MKITQESAPAESAGVAASNSPDAPTQHKGLAYPASAGADVVPTFEAFPKIPRLTRHCVVTEKIDGTNGQVIVLEDGSVHAASRSRIIQPNGTVPHPTKPGKFVNNSDNHGFAAWVAEHAEELRSLGPGRHFGEWWGLGINSGYGLAEKRFSLFNVARWGEGGKDAEKRPACCLVVPVLYAGLFSTFAIDATLAKLIAYGSVAAPGFMDPEGIVVWHDAAQQLFKKTVKGDEYRKGYAPA